MMRSCGWGTAIALMATMVAAPASALAGAYTVEVGRLAEGLVVTPTDPAQVVANGAACHLDANPACTGSADAHGVVVLAGCGAPTAAQAQATAVATFAITCGTDSLIATWAPLSAGALTFTVENGVLSITGPGIAQPTTFAGSAVLLHGTSTGWARLDGNATAPALNVLASGDVALYSADGHTGWRAGTVQRVDAPTTPAPATASATAAAIQCGQPDQVLSACRDYANDSDHRLLHWVCFTAFGTDVQYAGASESDHVLPPNEFLHVLVARNTADHLDVTLSGTPALTEPAILDVSGHHAATAAAGLEQRCEITHHSFAPRAPGAATLTVDRRRGTDHEHESLEIVVDQRYWGALRVGIGVPFLAVDRAYSAEAAAGGMQPEIVSRGSFADLEVVAAFAMFFDGARSYVHDYHPSAGFFVATGVVAAGPRGVQALTSIYLGIEFELMRSFTIGPAFVLRRVQRLDSGHFVGEAIAAGSAPWGEMLEPGFALLIGVSPEFLQFAGGL